jgi:hypothetical protein
MNKNLISVIILLLIALLVISYNSRKIRFVNVVLPYYGYSEYCNLKTLHVANVERPKQVDFSFDDRELVILAKGDDGKNVIADFKYTQYAVLYLKYGLRTHKFTITKTKGRYYVNGRKYDTAQDVIEKIYKL